METLSIKELAPYLPYGLKIFAPNDEHEDVQLMTGLTYDDGIQTDYINEDNNGCKGNYWGFEGERNYKSYGIKPLLRPLSDLTKGHIDYIYFAIISTDNDMYGSRDEFEDTLNELLYDNIHLPVLVYNYLLENHFDVFRLIEKGLAIDLNTIKETVK